MKKQEKFISKEEKKKTGKLKRAIAVGATTLAAVGLCLNQTGALAYLTDYAHVTNKFTEGKVSITPSEPNWTHDPEDPGDKEQVTPGDIFNKDPQITADEDSISPAFVYMQVKIPYGKVTKVNDDGTLFDKDTNGKRTTAHHMLITYGEGEPTKDAQDEFLVGDASLVKFDPASEGLDTSLAPNGHSLTNNINDTKDGWTLLQVEKTGLAAGDDDANGVIKGYLVFTYAYNSMLANTDSINTKYADLVGETIQKKTTHNVYQCMKDCCSLSEHHRLGLIRDRKIPLERIEQDYFTCPTNWRQKDTIIAGIKEKYPAYTDEILMNIPGFFYDKKRGKLSFTGHKGLGILIRNSDSRIVAIQIRKDTIQEGDSRYIWFSSSFATYNPDEYNGGNGCGSPKDVCYPQMLKKHTLCITEGRFKSEKLTESGNISISVQGVTSWHGIEETIKHMNGIHNVFIFFDADILGKHVLFMQSEKMIRKIQDEFPGLYIRYAFWSKKNGKGIDDCIIAGNISKVKYYEAKRAAEICNDAYTHALGEYHVANLRELKQERAKEFEDYLQILTESMLGL